MQGSPRAIFEGRVNPAPRPGRRVEPAPRHLKSLDNFKHLSYAPADLALPAPDPLSGVRVRKTSLPVRLALLVAGTTLPLIVFAAVRRWRCTRKREVLSESRMREIRLSGSRARPQGCFAARPRNRPKHSPRAR